MEKARKNLLNEHGTIVETFEGLTHPHDIDFDAIETAYKYADRSRPAIISKIRKADIDDFESTLTQLQTEVTALEEASNVWQFLDVYRRLLVLTNAGQSKRIYEELSQFSSELTELENDLKKKKKQLEAEDFEVELPDTEPFDEAQTANRSLAETIEGGL
jgi:DNA repair exonuclease SbcCD ATPase subunit